jgi:outer membrane murein-binding lipoprotein Lpp
MRRASILAVLLLALLGGGCGESKEEKFKKDFKPLNARIVSLGRDVGTGVAQASGKSDSQIEDQFGDFADRLDRLGKDVDDLDPPGDLKKDTDSLVKAMEDAETALRGIEVAAKEKNSRAARSATLQLVPASERLRVARLRLARKTGR